VEEKCLTLDLTQYLNLFVHTLFFASTFKMTLAQIQLDPVKTPGICHVAELSNESADMASRCLQANRSSNHIFTTSEKEMGVCYTYFQCLFTQAKNHKTPNQLTNVIQLFLHNHVVYHVLSLWAMGASAKTILAQTKRNFAYQLIPPKYPDEATINSMQDPVKFKEFVGKEEYFLDFCQFFERELEKFGSGEVIQRYLVGSSDVAKNLFPRIYHGMYGKPDFS
jgi:hypothetical protein